MDLHRVRRLGWVLVASQVRASGRNANPRSWSGQPAAYGWGDLALFLGALALSALGLRALAVPVSQVAPLVVATLPYLPMLAVGSVLVGGLMFELTTTAKFASSDAANWLPLRPEEYVLASAAAVAYTYSLPMAAILGAFGGVAIEAGLGAAALWSGLLSVVGLLEGALLVEMVRSIGQRAGLASPRRGHLGLVVRGAAIAVLIVVLQLAFNPVFLFDSLQGLHAFGQFTAFLPPFWGTYAVLALLGGTVLGGVAFTLAAAGFAGALLYAATVLRRRFWSVTAPEYHFGPYRYGRPHAVLGTLGLSRAESALVAKDLHGFGRRREMLPQLVVPIVLLVVIFLETSSTSAGLGTVGVLLYAGWASTFTALLISTTSLGQERKAFWHLYAAPIPPRSVFRAKVVAAVIPAWAVCAAVALFVALVFRIPPQFAAELGLVAAAASFTVAMWGLAFAARYSDYEERPRPQPMRPGAMLAAIGSGSALALLILVPGTLASLSGGFAAVEGAGLTVLFTAAAVAGSWVWARRGFERLMRELPF